MKGKISIIVPVFNGEQCIEKCVSSICKQTYRNIEIVIINDGSTDNTEVICEKLKSNDQRINTYTIKNCGVADARNYGINKAVGEYIMFVDADDYIDSDMCESLLHIMIRENVDIVVSKAVDEDPDGKILNEAHCPTKEVIFDEDFNFCDSYANYVCWGTLYKRRVIGNVRFDNRFYVSEDSLFFYMVLNNYKKYYIISEKFYHYVIYPNSASNGVVDEKKYTEILAWKEIKNYVSVGENIRYVSLCAAIEYRARLLFRKSGNADIKDEILEDLLKEIYCNKKIGKKYLTVKGRIENIMILILKKNYPKIIKKFIL